MSRFYEANLSGADLPMRAFAAGSRAINSMGQLVFSASIDHSTSFVIDTYHLPDGMYYVRLKGTSGLQYAKVRISR
jgi:hypothetical protein